MTKRYAPIEVRQQQERFELLLEQTDLVKLSNKILDFMIKEKGCYNHSNFLRRVLNMYNVKSSMYHPSKMKFYGDLLIYEAFNAKMPA